jgi:hypothetical protein
MFHHDQDQHDEDNPVKLHPPIHVCYDQRMVITVGAQLLVRWFGSVPVYKNKRVSLKALHVLMLVLMTIEYHNWCNLFINGRRV